MNKLQRYSAVTKTGIETVCLDADVSALEAECNEKDEVISNQEGELVIYRKELADAEAENERLGRQFSKLSQKLAAYTFLPDTKFPAFENGKETGYWDAHEQSATTYKNTTGGPIVLYIPISYTNTITTGTVQVFFGSSSTPGQIFP